MEDLKTEDFIQSAEISSDLKIDSSTVERIEGSHTSPNFALVQFSVGEQRAQVRQRDQPSTFKEMLRNLSHDRQSKIAFTLLTVH